jgi:hypothetical protein
MSEPRDMIIAAQELGEQATLLSTFGRGDITEAMMQIGAALNEAARLSQHIQGVQEQLEIIFEQAKSLSDEGFKRDDLLQCLADMAKMATVGQETMQRQRDAVLDEMSEILNRLDAGDFFSKDFELGRKVYGQAMETHNEAFWESLPYDMAERFGKPWTSEMADLLVSLLIEDEDTMADDRDMDVEDIIAFRSVLFDIVKKLYDKGDGDKEDGD